MRDQEQLDERTRRNLVGVHRALQLLVERSEVVPGYQMCVTEGVRDIHRQAELLKAGASKTMNSRHLTGHAFDFAMFDKSKEAPDDFIKQIEPAYHEQWHLFQETAKTLNIAAEWGGAWPGFKDGTHVQLSWADYPLQAHPKTARNSKTIAAAGAGLPITAFVPELLQKFKELTGSLSFLDTTWMSGIQLVLLLGIAAYIVNERLSKLKREGV